MANKMLIDASHPEETRVTVVRGNRVEEFDFESANKKQLRGNIYLAKVIRVEPSLQAAFVDYGGNRHGFLAFSEIHPDYYQIPVADRQALIEEEARHERDSDEAEDAGRRNRRRGKGKPARRAGGQQGDATVSEDANLSEGSADDAEGADTAREDVDASAATEEPPVRSESERAEQDAREEADHDEADHGDDDRHDGEDDHGDENGDENGEPRHVIEQVGAGDALEELPERPRPSRRQYKIQEVIKRRQVLLVQVVKEERGNKGAALTTYLSLAGRYSVLMPNTGRGGGISRKITSDSVDRKRLKEVATRTSRCRRAWASSCAPPARARTKPEIKRDFEYLMRLWETVRDLTLQVVSAPMLVYEEGSLDQALHPRPLQQGHRRSSGFRRRTATSEAKDFMRMLMPSHAKIVQPYRDSAAAVRSKSGVEAQLDAMFSNTGDDEVRRLHRHQPDRGAGRGRRELGPFATREHNIEDTAHQDQPARRPRRSPARCACATLPD